MAPTWVTGRFLGNSLTFRAFLCLPANRRSQMSSQGYTQGDVNCITEVSRVTKTLGLKLWGFWGIFSSKVSHNPAVHGCEKGIGKTSCLIIFSFHTEAAVRGEGGSRENIYFHSSEWTVCNDNRCAILILRVSGMRELKVLIWPFFYRS